MPDLPARVDINEEGPREGFQIEPGPIGTADKIALVDALSATGIRHIQVCSFVSPKLVPGWSDAEAVVAGFTPRDGVDYTALWFNEKGLERALAFRDRLHVTGSIALAASERFSQKNLNRDRAGNLDAMRRQTAAHVAAGVPVTRVGVMAAFGCNFAGDIPVDLVLSTVGDGLAIASDAGETIRDLSLADTMGWATPSRIERVVGAVRSRWPELRLTLHLHDTRGLGIANAHAGLRMGVDRYDSTVGGLGGCPFAAHKGAPGNIATEELVLLCEEMGIATGIDLDALIEVGHLAERIVGHPLPSAALRGGSLGSFPGPRGMTDPKPLRGVRVLEFSHTIMGPCAGVVLADMGADVVKVEPAPGGDHTRLLPGFASGFFATFNRNKRSLAIDLKSPDGRATIHRLVEGADIVLENYGPGTMERLGCGWEELSRINPRLVYLALKGFLAGPYEARPALDEVVQFQAGLAHMTGPPGQPLRAGASIIDILGAVFGVTGALAALRERDTTGRGQRVGSALFETAVFLVGSHMAGTAATGEEPPPMPARRGAWGIYDLFETSGGEQLFVGVTSDQQWRRFCEQFGLSDLLADAGLATNAARARARPTLIPRLREVIAGLSYEDVSARCGAANISWAPVGRPADLFSDPHLLAGGGLLATAIAAAGGGDLVPLPALPLEFGGDRSRAVLVRQPPRVGEHNREVLAEAGLDADGIDALYRQGVLVEA